MQKTTITEIAKKLDLSVATVSRAINPETKSLVKPATRRRVIEMARARQYSPNAAAKRLVTGKSRNIAIFFRPQVASLFFDDYYSKMIAGAISAADKTSYNLNLSVMKERTGGFDIAKAVREMDIAGAIICTFHGVFDIALKSIDEIGVPVVIMNQYKTGDNPSCFMVDNFKSAYDATQYLIGRGHTRIAIVRGSTSIKDAQDRYMGFRRALSDNGIAHDAYLEYQTDFCDESGRKAVRHFFGLKDGRPSAIFFSCDAMAMTAINEIRRMGLDCPADVSVMGFDGIDAGRYSDPPLTTVLQPIYEMAGEAVRQLMRDAADGTRLAGSRYFTAKIIERGSVATLGKR
jgi:LacI family transcriptional regulator